MWIQAILIAGLVAIFVYLVRSTPGARHLAIRRITVFLTFVAGIIVILAPGWLTAIANLVGIGRGADLLFYVAIVAFLFSSVVEYKRSLALARTTTQLAREIALLRVQIEAGDESTAPVRRSSTARPDKGSPDGSPSSSTLSRRTPDRTPSDGRIE